ncbi:hypothetical protein CDAR_82021 [Caerostris darwini]|uniref:Uncharacterized protein n=1 Tax=Caerostris darwini TaxID=1538125 RepID=A0AAV4TZ90_9ARAC|nr:hypothetical protein CDAR_82021 [Caerostris darwini]
MDLTPPSDERYRLPSNPPLGSDEFLYLHAETISKIIELKAKTLANFFRPKGLDQETNAKLDLEYRAYAAEMDVLCDEIGLAQNKLPDNILALHEKIKPIHLRLHGETTSIQEIPQKSPPIQKGKGKELWMQRASRLHQSISYAKTPLKLRKILLLYQQVTLSLSLLTSLHRAMFQPSLPQRRPANFAFHHTLFVRTRTGF